MDLLSDIQDVVGVLGALLNDSSLRSESVENIDDRFYALLDEADCVAQLPERQELPWGTSSLSIVNFSANPFVSDGHTAPISLKVCIPMPDELLGGWLGRMRSLNCQLSQAEILRQMLESSRQVEPDISSDSDISKFGAIVLQVSSDDFLKFLTFDAFNRALIGPKHNKPGTKSSRHLAAYERHAIFKLPGGALRSCSQCVKEDLQSFGFSYWRRAHQLAGVLWCHEHDLPLLIANDRVDVEKCPHEGAFAEERRIGKLIPSQIKLLKRYGQMAKAVLEEAPQVLGMAASEVFSQQTKKYGLRSGKSGKKKLVSTYLQENIPSWWLSETFPKVKWQVGKHITAVDSACTPSNTQRYTTNTYSLLAAIFFEEPEEAIGKLMNPQRRQARAKGAAYWSRREIFDLYVEKQGVVHKVAEDLKMNPQTVYNGLRNQGLPAFGNSTWMRSALSQFLAGASVADVCSSKENADALEEIIRAACTPCQLALAAIEREQRAGSRIDGPAYGVGR